MNSEMDAFRFHHGDNFFELVRTIERLARWRAERESGAKPSLGRDGPASRESIRFHAASGLAFPSRAVERIWRRTEGDSRIEMDVTFMGLTGPSGVLPWHYSNLVQSRNKQHDTALGDFLDLFNHRLLALFYRAWSKYRLAVQEETYADNADQNPFTPSLQALAGQPSSSRFDPQLFYAGHFSRHTRSGSSLEQLLADFLDMPVVVESFVGQWLSIAPLHRLRIGTVANGRNNALGEGVMAGRRLWDMQSKLAITIGPVNQPRFEELLPGGCRFDMLRQLLDAYAPSQHDIELRYLIDDGARTKLGRDLRLGRNVWLQRTAGELRGARLQLRRRRAHHR